MFYFTDEIQSFTSPNHRESRCYTKIQWPRSKAPSNCQDARPFITNLNSLLIFRRRHIFSSAHSPFPFSLSHNKPLLCLLSFLHAKLHTTLFSHAKTHLTCQTSFSFMLKQISTSPSFLHANVPCPLVS